MEVLKKILKELIRGDPITKTVDVYSYAVILWEMLSRELPWKGNFQKKNMLILTSFHFRNQLNATSRNCWITRETINNPQ
jgi:hypothetical protein